MQRGKHPSSLKLVLSAFPGVLGGFLPGHPEIVEGGNPIPMHGNPFKEPPDILRELFRTLQEVLSVIGSFRVDCCL